MQIPTYIIVTPVKDEEAYIAATLRSVTSQTIAPLVWVIVDDGSTDSTPLIVREYATRYPWIHVMRVERDSRRRLGVAEIVAFAKGYAEVENLPHDFVVKLDGDVDLPCDYFERLLQRFAAMPGLGIAAGAYLEQVDGFWMPVSCPSYHACGASKMLRRECYKQIDGFILQPGWDTVDEIRAQMAGWQTVHFPDIFFRHLKSEGSAAGSPRTQRFHGDIYYRTGGGLGFFLLKCINRGFHSRPYLLSGVLMFWGFLRARLTGTPRSVTPDEARFYRRILNRRLIANLGTSQHPSSTTLEVR